MKSLYIHIPFCKRRCLYCDFYSTVYDEAAAISYIKCLANQISGLKSDLSTIYIGGGTPTALNIKLLEMLLRPLTGLLNGVSEFTIEANPESLDEEKLKLFLDSGVNRLSIGVQSLRGDKLKKLGRLHTAKEAKEAVALSEKKGFKNISIDLIFGVWAESPDGWQKELEEAVKLPIDHISCYSLTYEKNTPLFSVLKNRSIEPLEDDRVAGMYEAAIDMLGVGGFKQYEVSNFAKEGYECSHNISYWENNSYVGLGASAVSYIEGTRSKNVSDIAEYVKRIEGGKNAIGSSEKLSPIKRARETAAVKIRTKEGIGFDWFRAKTGYDFCELEKRMLPKLIEDGLVKYKKEGSATTGVCLKRKGFLFCDTVSSALL